VAFAIWSGNLWAADKLLASFLAATAGGFTSTLIATGSLKSALWSAVSAAAFWGIGTGFSSTTGGPLPNGANETIRISTGSAAAKIAAHAGAGGVLSHLQGGKFGNAFFAAGVTKWASPAVSSIGMGDGHQSFADLTAQTVVAATVGGTASVIAGGSFGNGAQTAAFQYLFNQVVSGNQTLISITNMRNQQPQYSRQFTPWEECHGPQLCADPVAGAANGSADAVAPELLFLGPMRAAGGAIWRALTYSETKLLQVHLDAALARFATEGFTARQKAALAKRPGLYGVFRGERIDTFMRQSVAQAGGIPGVYMTPRGAFGPDFYSPTRNIWWDVTRQGQWAPHVFKYNPSYGYGVLLKY
jgi:hypothetical protein